MATYYRDRHQHVRRSRRARRSNGKKKTDRPVTFYKLLARFDGFCRVCSTSYTVGDQIYWCPKTPTTHEMTCHALCYLKLITRSKSSRPPATPNAEPSDSGSEPPQETPTDADRH